MRSAPFPFASGPSTPRSALGQTVLEASASRRAFLRNTIGAVATFHLIPRSVLGAVGKPGANSRPALAGVGVGGVGFGQLQECEQAGFQIVALCDVDDAYAKKAYDRWPQARRYRDYRELLRAEGDRVDAVYVGTPDHTHAVIVTAALRRKKHVCCVKPMTRTIHESRAVVAAAKAAGVPTQVTAAANTSETACRTCELIWAGGLGAVREVHVWSNRPVWPQGMTRPPGEDPIPQSLDWDLWLGPAPARPYKGDWPKDHYARGQIKAQEDWIAGYVGVYHPFNFRGWWDFGTGALGDMGCHHFNPLFRALKLTHPQSVHATSSKVFKETAPLASIVTLDFPARQGMPPVRVVWYDGGLKPPVPQGWTQPTLPDEGNLYVGDDAKLLVDWQGLTVLPAARAAKLDSIPKTLPRRSGTWGEWIEACRGGEPAGCHFEWAGYLTEAVLLGNISLRVGKALDWDAAGMKFTNLPEANAYVREGYRAGWSLEA